MRLTIERSGHKANTIFGVVPKLATRIILGTAVISMQLLSMETNRRRVSPKAGRAVTIVKRFEDDNALLLVNSTVKKQEGTLKRNSATRGVAEAKKIPQRSEAILMIYTAHARALVVKARHDEPDNNCLRKAERKVETLWNEPYLHFDREKIGSDCKHSDKRDGGTVKRNTVYDRSSTVDATSRSYQCDEI